MGRPHPTDRRLDRFLGFRPRSIEETKDFLEKRLQLSEDEQEKHITKLISSGILDDLAFTRWWVDARTLKRPRSFFLIKHELYKKGVSKDIIEKVLKESGANDKDTIKALLEKKIPSFSHKYTGEEMTQKLIVFLMRRGYSYSLSRHAVEDFLSKE
ncbi:hypothetical protein A2690_00460 [Candidatus Roizmanbacteria bacterium RIFCSPHIGHO2_01_FULL_39_12b]|uniref:Regulatory protein RecX n=1 Tax=Candidatus Roizmanbacteria bacterium RIFCSPHIGHO2_01_FULL_39_12b TaxID=1802030 RepID=A0A1F7G9D8_9BACT|nr:MAG: hypothetical protein A2690_00460 [Candidatus Roizmanbacteria bacterium RIFCSPHIGHO2_01_FULL_39_12b]OGK46035.1 MAG: hypothetical protein A3B46_00750 [Candidatus Roizmanbacteria bacterium RIFCSPLOWO2_01_FULL_39_19]